MSALDLMARLLEIGIELHVDGDDLVLRHYDVLDDAVVDAVRANKPTLIAVLAGRDEGDNAQAQEPPAPPQHLAESSPRTLAGPVHDWRRLTDTRVALELGMSHRLCPGCDDARPAPLDGLCFRCDPRAYR